ncbi:hypothetical protein C8R44DRAFT_882740 [Mycena epipterygia]|nr:hypothetical protein C8R44DRAFT_882740 [Mycena epipterygia]
MARWVSLVAHLLPPDFLRRFSDVDDANIIHFLAHPSRIYQDPKLSELYKPLGPEAAEPHEWSRLRKANAWQRRAGLMEDLDGRILRQGRLNHKLTLVPKSKSTRNEADEGDDEPPARKKKTKTVTLTLPPKYDIEGDVARIAADTGCASELVRRLVGATGSIVEARELIEEMMGTARGNEHSDSEEEGSEYEEVDVKPLKKKQLTRVPRAPADRQRVASASEDSADDEPVARSNKPKSKAAPKTPAALPKKMLRKRPRDDDESALKPRSAYPTNLALKPDPDAGPIQSGITFTLAFDRSRIVGDVVGRNEIFHALHYTYA